VFERSAEQTNFPRWPTAREKFFGAIFSRRARRHLPDFSGLDAVEKNAPTARLMWGPLTASLATVQSASRMATTSRDGRAVGDMAERESGRTGGFG